jgi:hypothetical protein
MPLTYELLQKCSQYPNNQVLVSDYRILVRDNLKNILHKLPVLDRRVIKSDGEFFFTLNLSNSNQTYYNIDKSVCGFSGDTSADDVDFVYIETSAPILVKFGDTDDTTRNINNGSVFDVNSFFVLKTNYPSTITAVEGFDQRILPFSVALQKGVSGATVIIYLCKFDC